ncbi:MAG TPA: DUF2752 domain-containing protein [Bacteroidia bacterium]
MDSRKVYAVVVTLCLLAYTWTTYAFYHREPVSIGHFGACHIKNLTGLACPSCGTTRSVVKILDGQFAEALYINPLGYVTFIIFLLILPMLLLIDLVIKKTHLLNFLNRSTHLIKDYRMAVPLIVLMTANWIWNLTKHL